MYDEYKIYAAVHGVVLMYTIDVCYTEVDSVFTCVAHIHTIFVLGIGERSALNARTKTVLYFVHTR